MEKLIRSVLNALGRIEVRGKDNIACMLSCMQALEKIAEALRLNRETVCEEASGSPLTPAALEKEEDHA
ncbi:MAG: hypothetical protein IJB81_03070 [Clostridia bacterium]|nr:hypothetical protein [Clostridia bacterium]